MTSTASRPFPLRLLRSAALSALMGAAGCTQPVMQSTMLPSNVAYTSKARTGMVYALPRGFVRLTASWTGKPTDPLEVTFQPNEMLPDARFRYVLSPKLSGFAHDDLDFTVEGGLLGSINAKTSDKLQEVVTTLFDISTEVQKVGVVRKRERSGDENRPFNVTVSFDPFDAESLKQAKHRLSHVGLVLRAGDLSGNAFAPPGATAKKAAEACEASICYRVPVAVRIRLSGGSRFPNFEKILRTTLPDPRFVAGYDITRAPCVDKTTGLTISQGMLTKIDLDKPSEVVECLAIPLEILKRIVQVPGALFQTEAGQLNAQKALIEAETNLLKAQATLLEQKNKAVSP